MKLFFQREDFISFLCLEKEFVSHLMFPSSWEIFISGWRIGKTQNGIGDQ